MRTTLHPDDLKQIAELNLQHYDNRAEEFWRGTADHDVSQNIAALLKYIEATPPYAILDLGCGPGRDLKTFTELGHAPVGLDGCARFAEMARAAGHEVWEQNLLNLKLPPSRFDGVFANAVLFHVPSQELARVLSELNTCLRTRGVLFSSSRTSAARSCAAQARSLAPPKAIRAAGPRASTLFCWYLNSSCLRLEKSCCDCSQRSLFV